MTVSSNGKRKAAVKKNKRVIWMIWGKAGTSM